MEEKTAKTRTSKKNTTKREHSLQAEAAALDPGKLVFALDIGTRSIIGLVAETRGDKVHVLAIEREEHSKRAMVDGQIEDIDQVVKVVASVRARLEEKLGCRLTKVCVAAAGRALKTQRAFFEMELPQPQRIGEEEIGRLEAGAIEQAEYEFTSNGGEDHKRQFYLVGYTVTQYFLDHYPISGLMEHNGKYLRADVIATFLPSEVVESIYTTMAKVGLEIQSMTLEPIAAINAVIPQNIRLLNLALADIGAGTSDIALSRDGSIVGYTMATVAGDEISETLMKHYLVDFDTAERIKLQAEIHEEISFTDILGLEHTVSREEVLDSFHHSFDKLCKEIADKIIELNSGVPSAVFLAGGGSKLTGIRERVAEYLGIELNRVAIAGNNFKISAESDEYDLNNPEYATPLGIAVSAGLSLINDSCQINLNGTKAKLFRNGILTVLEILMMNGYNYLDMIGKNGRNVVLEIDGRKKIIYGTHASPAVLRINGKLGKVTDVVRAGDSVEFTPAVSGADAVVQLKDVVEREYQASTTVNNRNLSMETYLKSGDVVLTGRPIAYKTKEEEEEEVTALAELEDIEQPEDMPARSGAEAKSLLRPEGELNLKNKEDSGHRMTEGKRPQTDQREEAVSQEEEVPEQRTFDPSRIYHFTVNGAPIELQCKPDGQPYYLMDMIEHSGLDLDNPKGVVVLQVNHIDGAYQQELKDGDEVNIFYKV